MNIVETANRIFAESVADYHRTDHVDAPMPLRYTEGTIEYDLYRKNWIDAVQWHLEDIIRDPDIHPEEGMAIKHRIDRSNQDRTDLVERIDTYFLTLFADVRPLDGAQINTESPAWAIDRLSILHLKIWHMEEQAARTDVSAEQHERAVSKLAILREQMQDMTTSISQLLSDYAAGRKVMKVYRQMKLYNDPSTNPVLYGKK